ncbi:hypothetical protein BAE44_0021896 [Dichanthelium oligosanthes]|uniref:Uncharacterized protein n=1 Tax=Dichanthelium oligosanthes TaxID=888268 RepID=A0A1E5UW10_9POAL|nr:hypothetical protein BAE44_0021896 [Dichanthelium oligosanthes]
MLLEHIDAEHTRPIILVRYGRVWSLSLPLARCWHVLVKQERRAVFLLTLGPGAAVSLVCMRANAAVMPRYMCRIALELPGG